jgi:hypothetical protein
MGRRQNKAMPTISQRIDGAKSHHEECCWRDRERVDSMRCSQRAMAAHTSSTT